MKGERPPLATSIGRVSGLVRSMMRTVFDGCDEDDGKDKVVIVVVFCSMFFFSGQDKQWRRVFLSLGYY